MKRLWPMFEINSPVAQTFDTVEKLAIIVGEDSATVESDIEKRVSST